MSSVEYSFQSFIVNHVDWSSSWLVYRYRRPPCTIGAGSAVYIVCTIGFCATACIETASNGNNIKLRNISIRPYLVNFQ